MWNRDTYKPTAPPAVVPPPVEPVQPVQPVHPTVPPVAAVPAPPAKPHGSTLVFSGDLSSGEDLVLEGRFDGRISLPGHVLTIGSGADVSAEVLARVVVLMGTLVGNVAAAERVEIRASGSMTGDLVTPRVQIADGATFNGRLETRKPAPAAKSRTAA